MAVDTMTTHKHPEDENLVPISRIKAMALRMFGPADSPENPLNGTRFDPALAQRHQHEDLEYRRQRWERRKEQWRSHLHHPKTS
jgi:hypothetical protein